MLALLQNSKRWLFRLLLLLVLITLLCSNQGQSDLTVRAAGAVPPGHSDSILRLKFIEGTATDDLATLLPQEAQSIIQKVDPLFTLPKSRLKEMKDRGNARLKNEKGNNAPTLADLSGWYEVRLVPGTDPVYALDLFQSLPFIEQVGPAQLMTELPATGDYTSFQGYLKPATNGVDAEYAWSQGWTGAGVTIYDVEYGWVQDHEDLSKAHNVQLLLNPGDTAVSGGSTNENHGASVLGELIADRDSKGVTGIAYGANIKLVPTNTTLLGWNVANAILLAAADGTPGDIILIEQQVQVCNSSQYGPAEWEQATFDAIQTATALGLVVVEAAGNGAANLDSTACLNAFNRSVRDSGAIIVGSGEPPTSAGLDLQRKSSSSYGSRVDMQGWGTGVYTTGTGTYWPTGTTPTPDRRLWYTATFSGTSSASPMVAGPAAIIQSIAIESNGAPLSPFQVRNLLVSNGTPQLGDTTQHIGPRANLAAAIPNIPPSSKITVTTTGAGDGICDTTCSLSDAILAANANSDASVIRLAVGGVYTLSSVYGSDPTYGALGLPAITSPVTILGNGSTIQRSSTAAFRLLQVNLSGELTLYDMTLSNGVASGKPGGALLNLGTTNLSGVTITNSSADNGGALANSGTLNLTSSTLNGNTASTSGGGLYSTGSLLVMASTLAGNNAPSGATIATSGSAVVKNTLLVKGSGGRTAPGRLGRIAPATKRTIARVVAVQLSVLTSA